IIVHAASKLRPLVQSQADSSRPETHLCSNAYRRSDISYRSAAWPGILFSQRSAQSTERAMISRINPDATRDAFSLPRMRQGKLRELAEKEIAGNVGDSGRG
ncbi:hypothetical protein HN011_004065, partial [Eciton burchellii]